MLSRVFGVLRRRGANSAAFSPPIAVVTFTPQLPAVDADEGELDGLAIADCVGCTFAIDYVDSKGAESRRRITIRSVKRRTADPTDILIRAYCHERGAARAFLLSRIREVIDLATGEVIGDPRAYFMAISVPGVGGPRDDTHQALERVRPDLQILVALARADGQFHPDEDQVILSYVASRCRDLNPDWAAVQRHIATLHPERDNYLEAVERFADADDDRVADLLRTVRRVAEADGVLDSEEFAFIAEIRDVFADAGRPIY